MNKNEEEPKNGIINKQKIIVPDIYFEEFLTFLKQYI